MNPSELIYDWNTSGSSAVRLPKPVLLNDETLRDGLQSPSVRDPSLKEKIEILHLMESLGINCLDLGLPGAGPRAVQHCEALAREIVDQKLKIGANCAARTHENDIRPIAEIVQRSGLNIQAATFIGSSPLRRYTEDWTDDFLLKTTEKAVKFAVSLGLESMYVTEDTSRCDPETVKRLYSTAINCGAASSTVTSTPCVSKPRAASSPSSPPPMTAARLLSFAKSAMRVQSSMVRNMKAPWPGNPSIGGTNGRDPVAMIT